MRCSCPACDAVLRLSDDLQPGKRIRCPKCGEPVTIPGDDEDAAPPARRRPKQQSRQDGDMIMYAGLGVLVLALVVGGVVLAVNLLGGPKTEPIAAGPPPAPVPQPPVVPPPQPAAPVPDPNAVATRPVPIDPAPPREPNRERPPDAGPLPPVGFEIGNLAPEIEAEDTDGQRFKLSDYRGQVVVLDFWGHW